MRPKMASSIKFFRGTALASRVRSAIENVLTRLATFAVMALCCAYASSALNRNLVGFSRYVQSEAPMAGRDVCRCPAERTMAVIGIRMKAAADAALHRVRSLIHPPRGLYTKD